MKFLHKLLTVLIVLAMVCIGGWFAIQNKAPVPLDILVYTFEPQSLALWVLAAFALGGLLGMTVSWVILLRTRASLSVSKKQLQKAREEVSKLRTESPATEVA
jgi:putative membrane protein